MATKLKLTTKAREGVLGLLEAHRAVEDALRRGASSAVSISVSSEDVGEFVEVPLPWSAAREALVIERTRIELRLAEYNIVCSLR